MIIYSPRCFARISRVTPPTPNPSIIYSINEKRPTLVGLIRILDTYSQLPNKFTVRFYLGFF